MTLPTGWSTTTLGDVAEVLDSRRIPVNARERAKRPGPVPYYGATGQVGWIDKAIFDEELVLLGEDGAPFLDGRKKKAYIITGPAWVNNHAHVLRAKPVTSNRFLKFALDSVDYRPFVRGTTRLKLTQADMRRIPIPLPPRVEQQRIVEAIEEQFSRLDAAAVLLGNVRRGLGPLLISAQRASVAGFPLQPLGEVCELYQPKTITVKELVHDGPYMVFGANGVIGRYHAYNHEEAEVLITCRGATCGTINMSLPRSWITGNAMVAHPRDERVLSKSFLRLALLAVDLRPAIGGSAQPQITRRSLAPLPIPVPPRDVQEELAAQHERDETATQAILAEAEQAAQRAAGLRRVLLREALAGRLVPRDLTEEIASASPKGPRDD